MKNGIGIGVCYPTIVGGYNPFQELSSDLISYHPMNRSSGDEVDYASQSGNWTTATNSPGSTTVGIPSGLSSVRTFDRASSQRMSIPYHSSLDNGRGNKNVTHAIWWKLDSWSNDQSIVGLGDTVANREFYLYLDYSESSLVLYYFTGGGLKTLIDTSIGDIETGVWYCTFWGWDADSGQSFIQTNMQSEVRIAVTADNPSNSNNAELVLGGRDVSGYIDHFDGELGSYACWSKVLTEEERTLFYNGGSGGYIPYAEKIYAPNTITHLYDPSNLDGSNNSTHSDGDLIGLATNIGSLSNAVQSDDSRKPVLVTRAINGKPALAFGGDGRSSPANPGDNLEISNSDTELNFIQNTGNFHIISVVRDDTELQTAILGSAHGSTDTGFNLYTRSDNTLRLTISKGAAPVTVLHTGSFNRPLATPIALSAKGNGSEVTVSNDLETYNTATSIGTLATGNGDTVLIGATSSGDGAAIRNAFDGLLGILMIFPAQLSANREAIIKEQIDEYFGLDSATAHESTAWIGDSITYTAQDRSDIDCPLLLELLLGYRKATANLGKLGDETGEIATAYTSSVDGKGYDRLVYLGGVNDVINTADTAPQIWARIEAVIDDALAQDMEVILVTVLPFKNYVGWDSGKQTRLEQLNTSILAKQAIGLKTVDAYTSFNDPADSGAMKSEYDEGDGLHPNDVGSAALAQLVYEEI